MWGPAKGSTTVQDNNDGTYFVSYICNTSGIYHVDIRLGGYAVLVLWGDVSCTSGGIDPGRCTVEGGGLDTAVAGSKAAFTISAFDTHGTPKQFGGDLFVLKATETPDLPRWGGGEIHTVVKTSFHRASGLNQPRPGVHMTLPFLF